MKRIVLCSDGTGNSSNKNRGTNVWKVFEAVDLTGHRTDPARERQVAFYDDGVGTEQVKLLKTLGGAFGFGLKRNVRELYRELCRAYEPGDEIYLFGFSRGAFTVRTLAGLIGECGIVDMRPKDSDGNPGVPRTDEELGRLVKDAYGRFRKHFQSPWNSKLHRQERSKAAQRATADFRAQFAVQHAEHAPDGRARIRFVGVWDTVDAVGLPIDELATALNWVWPFRFPDLKLGDHVQKACHALSIDDERKTFHPVMWDETGEPEGRRRIEQVWFAGVHSNVGGGYPKQGMSLVPLCWMVDKAIDEGLRFLNDDVRGFRAHANVDDKLYNSRAGLAVYYRYRPRNIAEICEKHGVEPKIHASVLARIALGTEGYAPGNLPGGFTAVPTGLEGTVPGESPEALRRLVETVSDGCPKTRPLVLERARPWIRLRVWAHLMLLIATGAALGLAGTGEPPAPESSLATQVVHAATASVPLIGERLYALVTGPYAWAMVAVLLALYFMGLAARRRAGRIFADFWRRKLPRDWALGASPPVRKTPEAA